MKMQYCDVSEHAPLSFSLSFVQEAQERPQTVVICQHLPETGVIFSIFQQLRLNTLLSVIFQQLLAKTHLPFCAELHLVLHMLCVWQVASTRILRTVLAIVCVAFLQCGISQA